jgi:hypothetical protein
VRVEREARTIMGSYMSTEQEACVAGLQNNDRLNHVLEIGGVAYGPRPAPISTRVLMKRKADATGKVLVKQPKAPEKKGTGPTKVTVARAKGGLKRPSDADILSAKSAKLSKSIVPRVIAYVATVCIAPEVRGSLNLFGASGSKADGTVPGAKKVAPSAKKHIILAIGALLMFHMQIRKRTKLSM